MREGGVGGYVVGRATNNNIMAPSGWRGVLTNGCWRHFLQKKKRGVDWACSEKTHRLAKPANTSFRWSPVVRRGNGAVIPRNNFKGPWPHVSSTAAAPAAPCGRPGRGSCPAPRLPGTRPRSQNRPFEGTQCRL